MQDTSGCPTWGLPEAGIEPGPPQWRHRDTNTPRNQAGGLSPSAATTLDSGHVAEVPGPRRQRRHSGPAPPHQGVHGLGTDVPRVSDPRVVIVGAGLMGRWHADAARHAGARLVAIVDPVSDRARAIAGAASSACSTLDAALATPVDVVHICTPLESHVALSQQALAAGCHVILEKPATPTLAEAEALAASARAAGRMLVPVHQFVFQNGMRRILARRDGIGPLRHIEFTVCSAGADGKDSVDRDRIAAEIAPHAFSLARALLQTGMAGLDWHLERAAPGEWRFSATTTERCTVAALISMRARPTFATCRVLGEHGGALADLFQGFAVFEPDTASAGYKVMRPLRVGLGTAGASAWQLASRALRRERAYPGLRRLCAATYAAIAGRGAAPFRDDEIVDVAAARERLLTLAAPPSPAPSTGS